MHARSAFLVPPGPWNTTTAYYSVVLVLVLVLGSSNPHTRTTRTSTSIPRTSVLCRGLYADHTIPDISASTCVLWTFVCVRLLRKAEGSTLILKSYSMILLSTYRFGNRCRSKGNMDWWQPSRLSLCSLKLVLACGMIVIHSDPLYSPSRWIRNNSIICCKIQDLCTQCHIDFCLQDSLLQEAEDLTHVQEVLGPPLEFLPKDIEIQELNAYRALIHQMSSIWCHGLMTMLVIPSGKD